MKMTYPKGDLIRITLSIIVIIMIWLDMRWAVYLAVTMLMISNELTSKMFREIIGSLNEIKKRLP